jgi:L-ribulose-5-phosphate 4-epimerase
VAWAQAGFSVPILGTTHADHLPLDIPCTKRMTAAMIRGDYEEETGNLIVNTLARKSYEDAPMVLVAGHGPFAWGATPEKAVYHSLMLEELSKIAYLTLQINPRAPRLGRPLIEKHYQRKHGPDAYYGQTGRSPKKGDRQ